MSTYLAESPGREQEVLATLGLIDFAETDAGWQTVLRDNPELMRDYEQLLAAQRAKARVMQRQAPAAPRPPEPAPRPTAPAPPPPPAAPAPAPAATAMPMVNRAPAALARTSMVIEIKGPVLPFAAARADAGKGASSPSPPASGRANGGHLATTAPTPPGAQPKPLPLAAPPAPAAKPSASPVPSTPPPGAAPKLTIEQHASLSFELAQAPDRATETLARYRITSTDKAALDRQYAEQFARDPAARGAWNAAYTRYRAWWQANRVNR